MNANRYDAIIKFIEIIAPMIRDGQLSCKQYEEFEKVMIEIGKFLTTPPTEEK